MKKVIGLGGVFLKVEDPKKLGEWYKTHLGVDVESWGGFMFKWSDLPKANANAFSLVSFFKKDTTYLDPSSKPFMLNFVVHDLHALVAQLDKDGISCLKEVTEDENGKFTWVLDPEGNKIELWEPPGA